MTITSESDYLSSTDPAALLAWATDETLLHPPGRRAMSDRQLRLWCCACCRQVWDRLTDDAPCPECSDPKVWGQSHGIGSVATDCRTCFGTGRINRSRRAVEVAERYAEGKATEQELVRARDAAFGFPAPEGVATTFRGTRYDHAAAGTCCHTTVGREPWVEFVCRRCDDYATQASLLRSIIGNPWRPVTLCQCDPEVGLAPCEWCDSSREVYRVAQGIYAAFPSVEPGMFGVLADALRETGLEETRRCERCQGRGKMLFVPVSEPPITPPVFPISRPPSPEMRVCPNCHGTGTDDTALALLSHLTPDAEAPWGRERCWECLGKGQYKLSGTSASYSSCGHCHGIGWRPRATPWVKGDWAIDLLRGETT